MFVESPQRSERAVFQQRMAIPKLAGLSLAVLLTAWLAVWSQAAAPSRQDWLPLNQACAVQVREGRGIVDVYLTPDVSLKLLVSNLGHSDQSAAMSIRAEPLSGSPLFRPVPVAAKRESLTTSRHTALPAPGRATSRVKPNQTATAPRPSPPSRDFWLHVTAEPLEDARGYQLVHGQLAVSRTAVQVYVDSCLLGTEGSSKQVQGLAADVAKQLETCVLAQIASNIGPITDVDHDGRLTVLISPWLSRLCGGETHVRGFVRSSDFRDDIASPFSNHADLLYLNADLPRGTALKTLLLHEVSHAALFSQPRGSQTLSRPAEWDDWLNEGLAHLSERSGGGDWSNLDYRVTQFYQQPERAPLVVNDYYRSGRWRDHGCRGATFLFLDWCAQEFKQDGGAEFIPAVVATGQPGVAAVTQVMGREFDELYRAWTISLVKSQADISAPSRIGRFADRGPHYLEWDISRETRITTDIAGTATRYVELVSPRTGWYRLSIDGIPGQPWQFTLVSQAQVPSPNELTSSSD